MDCRNDSLIFIEEPSSYALVGLVSLGLIFYLLYIMLYIQNEHFSSSATVYFHFSQLSLFLTLLSPLTFIIRSADGMDIICSMRTLSLQILPFCLLLGFNVNFIDQCLSKINQRKANQSLHGLSSFLIFLLAILIQTAVLLVWFYHQDDLNHSSTVCTDQCQRNYFLHSLAFQYVLLFLYSFQSTLRYHLTSNFSNLIWLLTGLFAAVITMISMSLYVLAPVRTYLSLTISDQTILAYGVVLFAYAFQCPLLYEQVFYFCTRHRTGNFRQANKMTFPCLSLTKEQQRAFMAAYVKRNLTASCENLTTTMRSTSTRDDLTRHSTLSVESLCPTLISTISHELSPTLESITSFPTSNQETIKSVYSP